MTNDEFQIWLTGYIELEDIAAVLSAKQLWIIHNHLNLVEKVCGELDGKNTWLKKRLKSLHCHATTTSMFSEFKQLTQQIKKWVLNNDYSKTVYTKV